MNDELGTLTVFALYQVPLAFAHLPAKAGERHQDHWAQPHQRQDFLEHLPS